MLDQAAAGATPARVLLVGDDPRAAAMIVEMLRDAWPHGLLVTQTSHIADAVQELADHGDSCVLLELAGGGGEQSLATLHELSAAAPAAPVVVISHSGDEDLGVLAVQAGAQDHLRSSDLHPTLLARSVRYAIERKRTEVRLTRQALEDPLTGLPNRVLFRDRLSVALDRSRRTGLPPAVMFLDVDGFKQVNDRYGHAAGDRLLRELSERFGALLRPMDTVARIGGDEFTFLFEEVSGREEAIAIAQRIGDAAAAPVPLGAAGEPSPIAVSIGIVMLDDPAISLEEAIRSADAAMYRAKDLGGGQVQLFDHRAEERLSPAPAHAAEEALRAAIDTGQLRVHYQPRVSINGHTGLVGFEALVRWEHPERGLIAPGEFIGLAEETGLIVRIGDWVIEQALAQIGRWRESRPGVTISVNLSGRQLSDPGMAERLAAALAREHADPSVLWLEVAEDALIDDPESTVRALAGLHNLGVSLAIDDFGRGHSSLRILRELPVDMLKIHESFVSGLGNGADDGGVVGAVVELGHALGLSVIAEGVETDNQLAHLRELGCDGAQGFLFSQPVPEGSVGEMLVSR